MAWPVNENTFGPDHVPVITGLSYIDEESAVPIAVDPVTGYLLVNASVTVDPNINIDKFGGTSVTIGQQLAGASIPVILPAATIATLTPPSNTGYALDSTLQTIDTDLKSNIVLAAGTHVIGHVVTDSGSVASVTFATPQHAIIDSGTLTAVTAITNTVTVSGTVTTTPPANASTNIAQINAHGVIEAGINGTQAVGGNQATNTAVSTNTFPQLMAGSDYGGTPKIQSFKVDSVGKQYVSTVDTVTAVTAISNALPAGTNVIGHVILDSGTLTAITNTVTVSGTVTTTPPANASTNIAQVNGHTLLEAGVNGTQAVGGNQATNSALGSNTYPLLIAGSDYVAITTKLQSLKVDSSGTASTNTAQINGHTTLEAGVNGTLAIGGAVATNSPVGISTYPLLMAGSDYGGSPNVQSIKVDSAGNASTNLAKVNAHTVLEAGVSGTLAIGGNQLTNSAVGTNTYPLLIAGSDYSGGSPLIQSLKVDSAGSASITIAKVNTHTVLEAGLNGALAIGGGGAATSQVGLGAYPILIAGSDYSGGSPLIQNLKVDSSGKIAVSTVDSLTLTTPTVVLMGKTTVTTAGTRVALASSTACKSVTIKALATNTGTIYVGDSTVAASNGLQLATGDTVSLDIANLSTVNIDSSVNGEGVTYLGVN